MYAIRSYYGVVCKDFISEFVQLRAETAKNDLFDGNCEVTVYDSNGKIAADTKNPDFVGSSVKDSYSGKANAILASIGAGKMESFTA